MRFSVLSVLLSVAFLTPLTATAHPVAQGSLKVTSANRRVELTMRVSLEEVTVQQSARTDIADSDPQPSLAEQWRNHGEYILEHLRVEADGRMLSGAQNRDIPPAADGPFVSYRFVFPTERPVSRVTISQDLLNEILFAPGNPWEATFVVTTGAGSGAPSLLTPRVPLSMNVSEQAATVDKSEATLFSDFLKHGVHHILIGYDHLLFASALVLSTLVFWDVIKVIFTFTLAHTVTLALAALNIIRLPSNIVEPLIALSIIVVAALNLRPNRKPNFKSVIPLAFFFGLFHGLGFAGGLLDAMENLPALHFWTALAGFSVGVEIGHQAVVIPLFLLLLAVRTFDAKQRAHLSPVVVRALALGITGGGIFFFVNAL